MTRKARRKKWKQQQRRSVAPVHPARPTTPWIVAGAIVATAALGGSELRAQSARSNQAFDRSAGAPAEQTQERRRFDIQSGPLSDVVAALERAGLHVQVALDAIKSINSPGVAGLMTDEQALAQILQGTGLSFRFTGARAATIEVGGVSESLDVRASAPVALSSPKYQAPPRDIPQTIEVISRASIEEQGVTTLTEALRGVPGITLQAGEGGGASSTVGDMFNMRGFNAANSLFVDGVRDDGLIARDVFNLEQVEVFLGPTGSDVGRGTAAGYVNMQTKSPTLQRTSSALLSFGTADQKRATVDLGAPVPLGKPGTWLHNSAVRLNVLWQDGGVPGRQQIENERRAVAPSFALGLNTPTRVIFGAQIMRQDNLPDYGIPGAAWADEPLAPTTERAARAVDQSNYYGSLDYDQDKASQNSYSARIEHDVNANFSLRNQTRYNKTHREAYVTVAQNITSYNRLTDEVTLARQGNERENSILSNQTNLRNNFSTGRWRHAANLGLEYTHENYLAPTLTGLGTRTTPVNIYNPDPRGAVTGFAPARSAAFSEGQTDTIALYAFDAVDLGPKWQLSGGFRWSTTTRRSTSWTPRR